MSKVATSATMVQTAEPAKPVAAPKVFAIPELLENILIYCTTCNLFAFQRINRTFKGVITKSPTLRIRMFKDKRASPERLFSFLTCRKMRRAMYPFTCHSSLREGYPILLTFEPSMKWLEGTGGNFYAEGMPCSDWRSTASWREITVGFNFLAELDGFDFPCEPFVVREGDSVGEMVDLIAGRLDWVKREGLLELSAWEDSDEESSDEEATDEESSEEEDSDEESSAEESSDERSSDDESAEAKESGEEESGEQKLGEEEPDDASSDEGSRPGRHQRFWEKRPVPRHVLPQARTTHSCSDMAVCLSLSRLSLSISDHALLYLRLPRKSYTEPD